MVRINYFRIWERVILLCWGLEIVKRCYAYKLLNTIILSCKMLKFQAKWMKIDFPGNIRYVHCVLNTYKWSFIKFSVDYKKTKTDGLTDGSKTYYIPQNFIGWGKNMAYKVTHTIKCFVGINTAYKTLTHIPKSLEYRMQFSQPKLYHIISIVSYIKRVLC